MAVNIARTQYIHTGSVLVPIQLTAYMWETAEVVVLYVLRLKLGELANTKESLLYYIAQKRLATMCEDRYYPARRGLIAAWYREPDIAIPRGSLYRAIMYTVHDDVIARMSLT